jgi:predicted transglutaminase-like cysteine proteinase
METALKELNLKFVYKKDGKIDVWRILDGDGVWEGDCEDYSLTLIWLLSDRNIIKFLWGILTFKYLIWYVKSPNGVGHAIVKINGMYYDNIQKKATSATELKTKGYKFVFPLFSILALIKLLFSYTIGIVLK